MSETLQYGIYGMISLMLVKDVVKPLISAVIKKPDNAGNDLSDREHKKCAYTIKNNLDDLIKMHDVRDHNQVPIWYFPREEMQELTREMRKLRQSLDQNTRRK